jgi:hypothetical protein
MKYKTLCRSVKILSGYIKAKMFFVQRDFFYNIKEYNYTTIDDFVKLSNSDLWSLQVKKEHELERMIWNMQGHSGCADDDPYYLDDQRSVDRMRKQIEQIEAILHERRHGPGAGDVG